MSTIKFIIEYLKVANETRIGMFVTYDKSVEAYDYMKNEWKKLITEIDAKELDFDLSSFINMKTSQSNKQFIPKIEESDDYLLKVNNMFQCMAREQATYYLAIIYQKIE